MGRLIFAMSLSLDGFVNDAHGSLDWVQVDEEVHQAFNDDARPLRASLYGTRMWDVMASYWPTADRDPEATPAMLDFAAIWTRTEKIVFSSSLESVGDGARLVRGDAVDEVRRLKAEPGLDMDTGGPTMTAALIEAGLVDEFVMYVTPVVLGEGTPYFPRGVSRFDLRLLESRSFANGVTRLRYERR